MKIARIRCNNIDYALPAGPHEGRNLRAFFGVFYDHDLWIEHKNCPDGLVPNDSSKIEVTDGAEFYTAFTRIN